MDLNDYYQRFNFTTIWLLFMTGARIGEATALQWEDIDFEAGTMRINKTLYYLNAFNYEFTSPKTRASVWTIPLDKKTLEYLSEWKEIQASEVKTDFVLSYNGVPTTRGSLSQVINIYSKAANVHRIRVHALRHSYASLLISIGEKPLIIKERLGHEDIQTTLETYGHLYPNSNFETAQHLNGLVDFTPAAHSVVAPPLVISLRVRNILLVPFRCQQREIQKGRVKKRWYNGIYILASTIPTQLSKAACS